jgi:Uma2 family endonuclease
MTAVLTPPAVRPPVRTPPPVARLTPPSAPAAPVEPDLYRFTVTDYERMVETGILDADAPVELLEGLVVTKMPRNPAHDGTLDLLEGLLSPLIPAGWFVRTQRTLRLPDASNPEPDVAIVRGARTSYLTRHPGPADVGLIVEVANTSARLDLDAKARVYATAGVPVYWVVDLNDRVVIAHSAPAGSAYGSRDVYAAGTEVPLVLDGQTVGAVSVNELIV